MFHVQLHSYTKTRDMRNGRLEHFTPLIFMDRVGVAIDGDVHQNYWRKVTHDNQTNPNQILDQHVEISLQNSASQYNSNGTTRPSSTKLAEIQ